ncbi:MAG: GNAT family N-acetyltransferase [Arhodomonas sp.]|nr:GNAT family N-acetyltransferase [Arhodomonas sp.]
MNAHLVAIPGAVAAMSITDQRPMLGCTVLTFLAVAPERRGRGLGTTLLSAVIERFRASGTGHWLFVEAQQRPARLYRRCGFRRLAMDYHVPHYGADAGCEAMSLMALPRAADDAARVDGALVAAMVRDAFIDGYGLDPGDGRLAAQLTRIPASVELEGC